MTTSKKEQEALNQLIILFDGYCHLCDGTVNILLKIDRNDDFLFAPLQSNYGKLVQEKHPKIKNIDSILVLKNDKIFSKSDAALLIASKLPWYFRWLKVLELLPKRLRDGLYDMVATNRYRILGKRETCRLPTPDEIKKFLT
jgi:predicted DCC family thiol-disulfide oxidoreductase YuxK